MIGLDYADFGKGGLETKTVNRLAIDYSRKGGLVTISAHLYNPANPQGGGLRDQGVDLEPIITPGNETYTRWMKELDTLADGLKELQDADVVVLWRPFHEMNGGWFWWGAKDPAVFIRVWRHMFDYFTKTKGLNNLLWVYGPNHGSKTAAYYAGDQYVDLIGLDAYTDFVDPQHIKGYDEIIRAAQAVRLHRIRPARPAETSGRLRLPAVHRRRAEELPQGDLLPRLALELGAGPEPQHQATPGAPLDRQPRGPAAGICSGQQVVFLGGHDMFCLNAVLLLRGNRYRSRRTGGFCPSAAARQVRRGRNGDCGNGPTFRSKSPLVATSYFYWYDAESKAHVLNGDGTDALTDHPPTLAGFSYKSIDWHAQQLADMHGGGYRRALAGVLGHASEQAALERRGPAPAGRGP